MRTTLRLIAAGALALLLGACSDSSTTAPDLGVSPLLNRDVAQVVADDVGDEVSVMVDPSLSTVAGNFMMAGPGGGFRTGGCAFDGARFTCPGVSTANLTVTRSFAFFDAQGNPQAAFDSITTASANFQSLVEGSISRDAWSASIKRSHNVTVSGLAGAETTRTWNGTGTNDVARSRHTEGGPNRTYNMASSSVTTNVVVPVPRGEGAWPLSGTITHTVTVTITDGEGSGNTRTRTATVTFNGTQFAPVPVGDETFTVDLAERRVGPRR